MSEPHRPSSLLAELQRLLNAQDAIALMPTPMLDMSVGSIGVDPMASSAIVEMQGEIGALVAEATDIDLVRAYQEADGSADRLDAGTLLAEIERRNLEI
ncbi:MAG: hypothetical protein EOO77_43385 [Oxalobacteraceae bacterium]|nr:MAG: hypothetical protein EOO77_43385 [Oxalobacteraceae bacterium]